MKFSLLFYFPSAGIVRGKMTEFSVNLHPSDLPSGEKDRRLRDVLELLLRCKGEGRREKGSAAEKRAEQSTPYKAGGFSSFKLSRT